MKTWLALVALTHFTTFGFSNLTHQEDEVKVPVALEKIYSGRI